MRRWYPALLLFLGACDVPTSTCSDWLACYEACTLASSSGMYGIGDDALRACSSTCVERSGYDDQEMIATMIKIDQRFFIARDEMKSDMVTDDTARAMYETYEDSRFFREVCME